MVDAVQALRAASTKYEKVRERLQAHALAYTMCVQLPPFNYCDALYQSFPMLLEKLMLDEDLDYQQFAELTGSVQRIFSYLDRYYVRYHAVPPLDSVAAPYLAKKRQIEAYLGLAAPTTTHTHESLAELDLQELTAMVEGHPAHQDWEALTAEDA